MNHVEKKTEKEKKMKTKSMLLLFLLVATFAFCFLMPVAHAQSADDPTVDYIMQDTLSRWDTLYYSDGSVWNINRLTGELRQISPPRDRSYFGIGGDFGEETCDGSMCG